MHILMPFKNKQTNKQKTMKLYKGLSTMMEMFWITVQYSSSQLPTTIDVAIVTEKRNFTFYLILTTLNLNSHMWLVAIVLDSTGLEEQSKLVTVLSSL